MEQALNKAVDGLVLTAEDWLSLAQELVDALRVVEAIRSGVATCPCISEDVARVKTEALRMLCAVLDRLGYYQEQAQRGTYGYLWSEAMAYDLRACIDMLSDAKDLLVTLPIPGPGRKDVDRNLCVASSQFWDCRLKPKGAGRQGRQGAGQSAHQAQKMGVEEVSK